MKKLKYLFILISTFAFAQKTYHLEGTINNKIKILMFIEDYADATDNRVMARYCYQNKLQDIVLNGVKINNQFILKVEESYEGAVLEQYTLNIGRLGGLTGVWTGKNKENFPVVLETFNAESVKNPYTSYKFIQSLKEDPYNFKKSSFLKLKTDSTSTINKEEIIWTSEKHCSTELFQLKNPQKHKAGLKINKLLEELHLQNAISQLGCSSGYNYSSGDGMHFSVSINYLNKNLLGFHEFSDYYCGGAHPDYSQEGYLLDLNTGQSYDIYDIISFQHAPQKAIADKDVDVYKDQIFPRKLLQLLTKIHKFEKPKNTNEDPCDYTDIEFWNYPNWSFTEKGIEFTPYFYRAARSCEESFLIEFAALQKYKNKIFPYKLQ